MGERGRLRTAVDRVAGVRVPALPIFAAAAVGLALAWGLWGLSPARPDLSAPVGARLAETGAENPVTAVLLSFRAYDTLLEVAVLLLAVAAVFALDLRPAPAGAPLDPEVLRPFLAALAPIMIVVGAYVLWRGTDAPGGAFQGGAIWGAIGVLWLLSRDREPHVKPAAVRATLAVGLAVFLAVAIGTAIAGGRMLEYPAGWSKTFIVSMEIAVALAVGATLTVLYAGRRPEERR